MCVQSIYKQELILGRKSKADSRKPEILEHTYQTLMTESLESASFAKIASRAGIAPSLISHYFNSKDELIFALTDLLMEKYDVFLMQDFQSIADPHERLKSIIYTRLREFTCTEVDDKVWYNIFAAAMRNDRVKKKIQDLYQRDKEELAKQLKSCSNENIDPAEIDILAQTISIAMEGLGYYAALTNGAAALPEETERLEQMFYTEALRILKL